jgi:hypothetical protein
MVYIAGDNNLSQAALEDINEMEVVGSNSDVKVVVQAEFSTNPTFGGSPYDATTVRGLISRDTDTSTISSPLTSAGGNLDMGNPATLTAFIQYAQANFPADHYALVLWSHGAGWKKTATGGDPVRGALADDSSGSFMSLPSVAQAITNSGVNIDVVDFDACLMAMYEVAYELRGTATYLVASEEVEPGDGNPYAEILTALQANPTMAADQLATTIVNSYDAFYEATTRDGVTKSAFDLRTIVSLDVELRDLADFLIANIATERANIQAARDATLKYQEYQYRDLDDFLGRLFAATSNATLKNKIAALRATLDGGIITNQYAPSSDPVISKSTGLSIFLPVKSQVSSEDLSAYGVLGSSQDTGVGQSWANFINTLVTGESGSLQDSGTGNFTICITWDNASVDLDLYIHEPTDLYAPWMGTTTPNGFFTADSAESGETFECYGADSQVESGLYDVFVNYFDGLGSTTVSVSSDINSPGTLTLESEVVMNQTAPAPSGTNPVDDYGTLTSDPRPYSDWYYAGSTTRSPEASNSSRTPPSDDHRAAFSKRLRLGKGLGEGDPDREGSRPL